MTPPSKKPIAEGIGTFCAVFADMGAIIINDMTSGCVPQAKASVHNR